MIELNDKQADRICEILDIRFDHYNSATYEIEGDANPHYYFWPEPICRSAFKIDRLTGELKFDSMVEQLMNFTKILVESFESVLPKWDESVLPTWDETLMNNKKLLEEHEGKKKLILDYLKTEKLI